MAVHGYNDIQQQIDALNKKFEAKMKNADKDCLKFVTMSCAKVEQTCKQIMRDTVTNPNVTYGKRGHHPSMAGNPPAPDSGTLLQSVTHSLDTEGDSKVVGYVGSILKNPDYPRFLEYGTSTMRPRPWLSTALTKCHDYMQKLKQEIFGK